VSGLDEIIGTLAAGLDSTGGLSSLALRLSAGRRLGMKGRSLVARVPASWVRKILSEPTADETTILIQASALLPEFREPGSVPAQPTGTANP
jgi:hypothetical protein